MNKEKILQDLEKRIDRNQYLADYFAKNNAGGLELWDFYRGKVEGLQLSKAVVENMGDNMERKRT